MLDDARIRRLSVRIVHDGYALIVWCVEHLRVETDCAILQFAESEAEKLVYHARIYGFGRDVRIGFDKIEIVRIRHYVRALEHFADYRGVAAHGYALVAVVEIVVVKGESARQALDDECGQVLTISAPLLFGVAFDEFGVHVRADEFQCLLLEVARFAYAERGDLLLDFGASLFGSDHSPKFAERIHIEGQVVQFAVIIRNRRIDVVVELGKLVDEVPHFLVRRVEDMRAVAMHVDAI